MKAIIKSILVLSLMIIFGPVTDSYAEPLNITEILQLCGEGDEGRCPWPTHIVDRSFGTWAFGVAETKEEAVTKAKESCMTKVTTIHDNKGKAFKDDINKEILDIKDKCLNGGYNNPECPLEECKKGCVEISIVETTLKPEFQYMDGGFAVVKSSERFNQRDSDGDWTILYTCAGKFQKTIKRVCTTNRISCVADEMSLAEESAEEQK